MIGQSVKYQYFAAFVVNLFSIGYGVHEGWTSAAIDPLISNETPLSSGKMTMDEATLMTSLLYVGALTGNIFFGYITDKCGRKLLLIVMAIPMIISWILIWKAENVNYLYVARVLGGLFGGSGYMIIPLFLSEISSDRVRGTLVSTLSLAENFGILLSYVIGNYCNFYATPQFSIVLTTLFAILFCLFPESPLMLVKCKKTDAAQKSIRFYQNLCESDKDHKILVLELNKLESSLGNQKENDGTTITQSSNVPIRIVIKAMLFGIVLVILNVCNGTVAITGYTATIFEDTGSNITPNMSAIVIGLIQLAGSCLAMNLVDRYGRKLLLTISTTGTALGLIVLGTYMLFKTWEFDVNSFDWIPLGCLSFVYFISTLGIQPLTLTVVSEIMPEKIKNTCMSLCMTLYWLLTFINAKYLPTVIDSLGFHAAMFIFAGICMWCAIFIVLFIPETKGKSYEEIMDSLQPHK